MARISDNWENEWIRSGASYLEEDVENSIEKQIADEYMSAGFNFKDHEIENVHAQNAAKHIPFRYE